LRLLSTTVDEKATIGEFSTHGYKYLLDGGYLVYLRRADDGKDSFVVIDLKKGTIVDGVKVQGILYQVIAQNDDSLVSYSRGEYRRSLIIDAERLKRKYNNIDQFFYWYKRSSRLKDQLIKVSTRDYSETFYDLSSFSTESSVAKKLASFNDPDVIVERMEDTLCIRSPAYQFTEFILFKTNNDNPVFDEMKFLSIPAFYGHIAKNGMFLGAIQKKCDQDGFASYYPAFFNPETGYQKVFNQIEMFDGPAYLMSEAKPFIINNKDNLLVGFSYVTDKKSQYPLGSLVIRAYRIYYHN
jgi:hypothetical protein